MPSLIYLNWSTLEFYERGYACKWSYMLTCEAYLYIYSLGLSTDPKTEPLATSHTPRNPLSTSRLPNTNPLCGAFSSILTRKTHSQFISSFIPLLTHLAWFLERLVASINPLPMLPCFIQDWFCTCQAWAQKGAKRGQIMGEGEKTTLKRSVVQSISRRLM